MVDPGVEGKRIYELLYRGYNDDLGAGVVGISGSQGSVKTSACLDIAEKKMMNNPDEIVFWRETFNSPMQCERVIDFPVRYFVEKGLKLSFINSTRKTLYYPDTLVFKGLDELYSMVEGQTLNVVFFSSIKRWTDLIEFCNSNINASGDWQSVFIDEMEGLYRTGSNNQTEDRWWDWIEDSGHVIKECRKSNTFVVGNYHDENLIDHRVRGKFMFYMYGFGANVSPKRSRVTQRAVDKCTKGEFYITHGRNRFGKIKIRKYFPPSSERLIVRRI